MNEENYKLTAYEWDYTIYSSHNDTIDSIDAVFYPELEWAQQPYKITSTPKLERTISQDVPPWLLA